MDQNFREIKNEINQSIFKQEKMLNEISDLKNENLFKRDEINKLTTELKNSSSNQLYNKEQINRLKTELNEKQESFNKFCNKIYNSTSQGIDKIKNSKNSIYSEHLYSTNFSDNIVNLFF